MNLIARLIAPIHHLFTTSQITAADLLSVLTPYWMPIAWDDGKSVAQHASTLLCLTDTIGEIELEAHLQTLRQQGYIEIEFRPTTKEPESKPQFIRMCRTTARGQLKQANLEGKIA